MIEHATKTDRAWIVHFYLVTNYFYFPNLTDLALIRPPPLALSGPRQVPGAELPVTLYPHPSGYVGLVVVEGVGPPHQAIGEAYDVAMPVLDELSTRYDVPLPVAHSMTVGVPSGLIHLDFPHHPKAKRIEDGEAVSSSNPFHAFLTFWKVWEEAEYVRNGRGAKLKRGDTKVREEIFPDLFAFGSEPEELADPSEHPGESPEERLRGEKFSKAKKVLNAPYRVALAHAGKVDVGKPLTSASYEDYQKVASQVPVIRYVANVVLENVRATFDADVEIEGRARSRGKTARSRLRRDPLK